MACVYGRACRLHFPEQASKCLDSMAAASEGAAAHGEAAPQQNQHRHQNPFAEPLRQPASRDLRERVGPEKRALQIVRLILGQRDFRFERIRVQHPREARAIQIHEERRQRRGRDDPMANGRGALRHDFGVWRKADAGEGRKPGLPNQAVSFEKRRNNPFVFPSRFTLPLKQNLFCHFRGVRAGMAPAFGRSTKSRLMLGPVVERSRVEIGPARPDDRMHFRVQRDLRESRRVVERPVKLALKNRLEINRACEAVIEAQT